MLICPADGSKQRFDCAAPKIRTRHPLNIVFLNMCQSQGCLYNTGRLHLFLTDFTPHQITHITITRCKYRRLQI